MMLRCALMDVEGVALSYLIHDVTDMMVDAVIDTLIV